MNNRIAFVLAFCTLVGCNGSTDTFGPKPPRPVTTLKLTEGVSSVANFVAGSVKPWKSEDVGFEVSGRLLFVLKKGANIQGRSFQVLDANTGEAIDEVAAEGVEGSQPFTLLAEIDSTEYKIKKKSVEAQLEIARQEKENLKIQLKSTLPAKVAAAKSDFARAVTDFDRIEDLKRNGAVSNSEFDKAENVRLNREADVKTLTASIEQTEVELAAAESKIESAQQDLENAKRDLRNTKLYGSFSGQIAEVLVDRGGLVAAGSPVLTLQLNNPISVEIELSASESQRLRKQQNLPFRLRDGSVSKDNAFIFTMDAIADPTTRTFTMTLLIPNKLNRKEAPKSDSGLAVGRTEKIFPLQFDKILGIQNNAMANSATAKSAEPNGNFFIVENAIYEDEKTPFIYVVDEVKFGDLFPSRLTVTKQRVKKNKLQVSYLGQLVFESVSLLEPIFVDDDSLYISALEIEGRADSEVANQWTGSEVVLDSGPHWMLRPGDLVDIDISGASSRNGFFVPMDAIYNQTGNTFIFVEENGKARQIQVTRPPRKATSESELITGSLVQIESPELVDGLNLIVGGVHFLSDDQSVRVISSSNESSSTSKEME